MTTRAEITEAERRLSKLLREYRLRDPYEPIVQDALRETFKERWPELAEDYEIRTRQRREMEDHVALEGPFALEVELVERSAVDRLGNLT